MALGDNYITVGELKAHAQIDDTHDDVGLADVVASVSRMVERYTFRQFNDAGSASARVYYADAPDVVVVDDFQTVTSLKADTNNDGTFATTIAAGNYTAEPLNGVVNGQTGNAYYRIRLHAGYSFPMRERPGVELNAQWGWAAVPPEIKRACLIQATGVFRRKFAPDGVIGAGDFGFRVSNRPDPDVARMLEPFRLSPQVA